DGLLAGGKLAIEPSGALVANLLVEARGGQHADPDVRRVAGTVMGFAALDQIGWHAPMVGVDALGMTSPPQRLQPADVGADERLGIAADATYRGPGAFQMSRRTIDAFLTSQVRDVSIGRAGAGWPRADGHDHAATDLL